MMVKLFFVFFAFSLCGIGCQDEPPPPPPLGPPPPPPGPPPPPPGPPPPPPGRPPPFTPRSQRFTYGPDGHSRRRPLYGGSNSFRYKLQRIEQRYRLEMDKIKRINFHSEFDVPYDISDIMNDSLTAYAESRRNFFRNSQLLTAEQANTTNLTALMTAFREERLRRRTEFGTNLFKNMVDILNRTNLLPPPDQPDPGYLMKLDSPIFYSTLTPAVEKVLRLFSERGHQIRLSGGSVRDLLNGVTPYVLDFTTTAEPVVMEEIFRSHGFQIIGVQGLKRHTFSLRLENTKMKVATLRRNFTDSESVNFVNEWQWDSTRRDFTLNAMYLGFDGSVYDYCNGYDDLKNKVIRFVGDPNQRIFEDYLRIVRYFRFFNRLSDDANKHDPAAIQAIRDNAFGLIRVSGKRLWREFKKIFGGKHTEQVIKKMLEIGLSEYLGFGPVEQLDIRAFERICRLGQMHNFRPVSFVGSLFVNQDQVLKFSSRMHLMADDLSLLTFVVHHKSHPFVDPVIRSETPVGETTTEPSTTENIPELEPDEDEE